MLTGTTIAAVVNRGDKVAIVQPDYFANRKLVQFFGGEVMPVALDYATAQTDAGLDLAQLRAAFESGAKVFLFSNPNNPAGLVYSAKEIGRIAELAKEFGVTIIADQLYSRLRYEGESYTHMRASGLPDDQVITIMGPSKTESPSGSRLGVAYLFPKLPPLSVGLHEFVRLLRHQANIIVTPGTEFGPHDQNVRLNFSQDRRAAGDAVTRLVEMADRYRA